MADTVRIGLLGCGAVGAAVARMVHDHGDDIALRSGFRLEVARVAVRDLARDRAVPIGPSAFSDAPGSVVSAPGVDVVAELIGGLEPARSLVLEAFEGGKPVVTAN